MVRGRRGARQAGRTGVTTHMKELVEELYLTDRGFVTEDYQCCIEYIDEHELDLEFHTFESGTTIWDSWVVPQKWSVEEAYIATDGTRIVDYEQHPLHLISYSAPFEGTVSRETLTEHVHTHEALEEAIPWHFRQNYRPWDNEWGFCASQRFVDSLDREEYYVNIDTSFSEGEMVVGEHHLPGRTDETIVLAAHLDHTGMANDDLAGVAVGCELMRRLRDREDRRYSYTFLVVQEIIGSAAYLATHPEAAENFRWGVFLEMPGNDNRLLLQQTFTGDTRLDDVAEYVLDQRVEDGAVAPFRDAIGNDELVFESPGYEIPMISVSRYPYPEYHTHLDAPDIISEARLEEHCSYVEAVIDVLETDFVPERTFDGLPSLANPKYDLYLDPREIDGTEERGLDAFRDRFFRYLDGSHTAFEIAREFGLEYEFVRDYLRDVVDAGLATAQDPF